MGHTADGRVDRGVPGWLPMCTDGMNYVVQSNEMIMARQGLSVNAAKIVRLAIMQIKPDDKSISEGYFISVHELSETLGIPSQNLYRDLDRITDEIMSSFLEFRKEDADGKDGGYTKIAWASKCDYVKKEGLFLRLNLDLEPYLIGLKKLYTQYSFMEVSKMKSVYSIRVYELIISKLDSSVFPKEGRNVVVLIDEILEMCKVDSGSYKRLSDLKTSFGRAVRDINRFTIFDVSYTDVKEGKKVVGFNCRILKNNVKALLIGRDEREKKSRKLGLA